jgi:hypothetical protein
MKQDDEVKRIWEEFKGYVTIDRFSPVEKIVYGAVGIILVGFMGLLINFFMGQK